MQACFTLQRCSKADVPALITKLFPILDTKPCGVMKLGATSKLGVYLKACSLR